METDQFIIHLIFNIRNMLYLIKSNNWLKIGFTNNLDDRLKHYNTDNPEHELISNREGDRKDESYLHSLFKSCEIKGEWMEYNNFIIELFNKIMLPSEINQKSIKEIKTLNTKLNLNNQDLKYYKEQYHKLKKENEDRIEKNTEDISKLKEDNQDMRKQLEEQQKLIDKLLKEREKPETYYK